jgi:DNA-binding NarL/FixJ family response regulator
MNAVDSIRVLLADDHELVRNGIRALLERLSGVEVTGEASNGHELVRLVEESEPHIVLTDIAMPSLNGLEVTRHLAKAFPNVRVVILSMYSDEEHLYLALRAGAAGYLVKGAAREELELAMRAVARGDAYISPALSKHLILNCDQHAARGLVSVKGLSRRQTEVLRLIAKSKTTKQIALDLSISAKTVESHRAQLMDRLEIHDIPGLVRFAIKVGLVELRD